MSTPKPHAIDWKLVLSIVTLLFGGGLVWTVIQQIQQYTAPTFSVSAINTLAGNNIYEITNHIIEGTSSDPVTVTWGLQVIPQYAGETAYGEVDVLVKDRQGVIVAKNQWDNFDKTAKPLMVNLDPYRLSSEVERIGLYGGYQENIFETGNFKSPEATFSIEIVQISAMQTPLFTSTLVIRNAPWYHYTTTSAWRDNGIDLYVRGKNLGEASDLVVISDLNEISDVSPSAWNNWPWVDHKEVLLSTIQANADFTATLRFSTNNQFRFEPGKMYLLSTYIAKKQNYMQFPNGATWLTSGQTWRLGSFVTQHLLRP